MNTLRITASQIRYTNRAFWRNPARAFFTFVFPLMFLVIFTALLGNNTVHLGRLTVHLSTYYVAAMGAFAVISSCYTNIAMSIAANRDAGVLKRIDGSPMPRLAYLASLIIHALCVAVVLVALTVVFGRVFYHAEVPTGLELARFILSVVVGAASFCALGLAISSVIPNADAAPPIVNATILPLLFISGVFIPFGNNTPQWIVWVARVFPVRHFATAMQAGIVGTPFDWADLWILGGWGLAGVVLATRYFRWVARTD
jgi:ABC-2 type transport system permease protein